MVDVFVTSAAENDFTEALCWYAERSRDAAEGFDAEFEAPCDRSPRTQFGIRRAISATATI